MLGDLPHRTLSQLAQTYGPIMYLRLGLVPAIVVSSPEWAELFLKTHDLVFASRPNIMASQYLSYGRKNMSFAPYGPYWRNIRKLCTLELLSNLKIEMFKPMRRKELLHYVELIKSSAARRSAIDISAKVGSLIEDMTYQMLFGFKDDKFNLKSSMQEGLSRRMKDLSKIIDGFLEKIIDEHVRDAKTLQGQHRDFIDVMLSLMESNETHQEHLDRDNTKAIMLDMLAAGMDTSTTVIDWTIAELLRHPRCLKLVQEELENAVGLNRMVEEKDLPKLDYLKMVIKESMRLHPVAPLLIPRESIEDITINGYFIPKKSRVLINNWALGRDPNSWSSNAEEFYRKVYQYQHRCPRT
ncbi:hypothetical protein IFM89_016944 [Coptis chinensis]|uniref:Cytochrome P450 n=1 Tax=Coptis chinensis TaxID=261450 RepID=A0A835H6L8_9MAGN|nr:hypothetical protein IFM89_016944 [Coptis chinensis]